MPKITKNKRGTWSFVVDLGNDPATGKRRQARRSGFRTKKEAEDELRRLQNDADKGIIVKKREGNITFEEFAQDWLEWYTATAGVKSSTVTNRQRNLRMAYPFISAAKIKDITKNTYDRFLVAISEKYAPNTVENLHAAVSMVLDYAVECGYLATNPAKAATKPKKAPTLDDVPEDIEEKYLSRAEVDSFLSVVKNEGDLQQYVLMHLLIFSGLRIGEALALEFKHIDFKKSMIKIRQTISTGETANIKEFLLQTPKTGGSIRDVEIDAQTLELLKIQILEQKKKRLKSGAEWYAEHDFLFTACTHPGYPLPYPTVESRTRKQLKRAGIHKHITLHKLRHTHASLLAESGATLEQIQSRLGHQDNKITRQIYLHITKDSSARMMDSFARFMQM